jgi:hypothetical protein
MLEHKKTTSLAIAVVAVLRCLRRRHNTARKLRRPSAHVSSLLIFLNLIEEETK